MELRNCLSLTACLIVASTAWADQGRISGMGDPVGLIKDDTDYLVHPSLLSPSRVNYFLNYSASYDKTKDWNINAHGEGTALAHQIDLGGQGEWSFSNHGGSHTHKVQLGVEVPTLGGSWAAILEYTTNQGKYDNGQAMQGVAYAWTMDDEERNWNARFLYATKVDTYQLGLEFQLGHKNDKNDQFDTNAQHADPNFAWGGNNFDQFMYMIPCNSRYYEANTKLSFSGGEENRTWAITFKAGLPFAADNQYASGFMGRALPVMKGDVQGFNAGADLWLRVAAGPQLSIPFTLSGETRRLQRTGADAASGNNYKETTGNDHLGLGFGLDYAASPSSRIATGLYFDHSHYRQDFYSNTTYLFFAGVYDYSQFPDLRENRVTLKTSLEQTLSPATTLRAGLNLFYGRVNMTYTDYVQYAATTVDMPSQGSDKGLSLSVGATLKTAALRVEPFIAYTNTRSANNGDWTTTIRSTVHPRTGEFLKTDQIWTAGMTFRY